MVSSILLFICGIIAIFSSFNSPSMSKANAQVLKHEINIVRQVGVDEDDEDLMKYETMFLS